MTLEPGWIVMVGYPGHDHRVPRERFLASVHQTEDDARQAARDLADYIAQVRKRAIIGVRQLRDPTNIAGKVPRPYEHPVVIHSVQPDRVTATEYDPSTGEPIRTLKEDED